MGEVLKAAAIGAALVLTITLIVSIPCFGLFDDIWTDGDAMYDVTSAIAVFSPYLTFARQMINNFVNPTALTICITFSMTMWLIWGTIKVGMFIVNLLHK